MLWRLLGDALCIPCWKKVWEGASTGPFPPPSTAVQVMHAYPLLDGFFLYRYFVCVPASTMGKLEDGLCFLEPPAALPPLPGLVF